ncbi:MULTISPECIES: hypothetical protein [Thermomonospora]|uniref:Uncharacterized protein n=1 Tax=Thermomonospora curvata (strain ATCC 19995 / DSM 43183 / JCM 3096 / KCTC 9072 / NBRC 15933 / NCIMB 10081 / Henssen B9) TaxID=471852 RepID=D1A8Q3_THECD|nr:MULTISPECIES: hypothetical protein [Thermomonospora]ACY96748.1 hypothetical protein Tcur_1165 [Thermomonospora curvata DSM 43183]PKK15294.1 MAG: hypothetical protein BUE48_005665 [Thermomonospora sp. CIF 1]
MPGLEFDVLAHLPLGAEEPLQGRAGTRFTREAGVIIGRPVVEALSPSDFPPSAASRVDFDRWRYFQIRFPFDLEEARYGQRYIEAQYEVTLIELDAVALQLGKTPLAPDAGPLPDEELTTFGLGQRVFRWRLRPHGDRPLTEGSRVVRVVLQLPPDLTVLRGEIGVSALLQDAADPGETVRVNQPGPQPFRLNLSDGAFDTLPEAP